MDWSRPRDPESPLPCKGQLAAALKRQGHQVSHRMVAELLHDMGYSLQANRTLAGTEHPDRNAQFEHLDRAVQLQLSLGEPVISVDTKKKELVGPFKNGGRELRPKGAPEQVLVHDFLNLGRVSVRYRPNEAWVSAIPLPSRIPGGPLTADAGGNGYRLRLWKLELQNWRMRRALKSTCATSHQGASGTRSKPLVLRDQSELARKAAGEPRGGGELDRGDHDPDGAAGSSQLDTNRYPAGRTVTTNSKPSICVETLSMVNGIIRCYPALRLNW